MSFLKSVSIFSLLPDSTLKTLIYFLESKIYNYRDEIIVQGSAVDSVYIILYGRVKLVKKKRGDKVHDSNQMDLDQVISTDRRREFELYTVD